MRVAVGATRTLGARCLRHLAKHVEVIGVDVTLDVSHRESCGAVAKELGIPIMSYVLGS